MTLQLVIDNQKRKKLTCRNSCELFDHLTGECPIRMNVDVDSPKTVYRCEDFINKESNLRIYSHSLEEDFFIEEEEEQVFAEFKGEKLDFANSTYPLEPDVPANREDATWYVSPCKTFGCWIINQYSKRFMTVRDKPEIGWAPNVYKSPYPLHDHKASLPLASRMAWYVDSEGYGQYVLLANGNISFITAPNPNIK